MNVDGLVQTVVRFVGETPPPVPPVPDEPTNPEFIGAQTGDPLFWILFGTLIAVVVACGVAFYLYRKRVLAGNVSAAHAQEFNPLKNTKLMFISAIVFLFVVFCCVFASQAISANASTSYNISVETPQVITATVSDEEGIVFDNLDGDNTSYIKNTDSNTLNYCYTKVESDIEGLEGVN